MERERILYIEHLTYLRGPGQWCDESNMQGRRALCMATQGLERHIHLHYKHIAHREVPSPYSHQLESEDKRPSRLMNLYTFGIIFAY